MAKTILAIGDTHMPWLSSKAFGRLAKILESEGNKFDAIVQVGDLYDMFSQGRWAHSYDLITPKAEIELGRKQAEEFWRVLQKRCPNAKCFQLIGNHDERPMKRLIEKAPEIASLVDFSHLWKFDGVQTMRTERDELVLDDIIFMHGFRSKLGDHARYNQKSTVCGHSHKGGVVYFPVKDRIIFELNAGYMGDADEVPLQYTKQKLTQWTHGFAIIDQYGPRFCPIL